MLLKDNNLYLREWKGELKNGEQKQKDKKSAKAG
jgi:hypothetical protein